MSKKTREKQAAEEAARAQAAGRYSRSNRRTLIAIGAVLATGLGLALWMTGGKVPKGDEAQAQRAAKPEIAEVELMKPGPLPENILGNTNAPVTIVEYASMTCPHCALFHKTVYPELKKKYVEPGKVRFIFREFPLDPRAAAASMLARCSGPEKYFQMTEVLFDRQEQWAFVKGSPIDALKQIARQVGMSEETFNTCINDKKMLEAMEAIRTRADAEYGVKSTPSFFVNGRRLTGAQDLAAFDAAIAPFLK